YMGETPTRPSTAQYNYVFDGWNPEIVSVTKDANYTATYVSFLRQYTVTFMDWDGTILSEQVVDFGTDAIAPTTPVREGYTFKGWDKDFSNVQSDLIVIAQYEKNPESAVEDIEAQENSVSKVIENQQLFIILPDGSKYSATGQKIQ
ncbi:MAG: InlB B-repeat-containing protein, partial [Paludibacteraceae bacterium]|nr:InlB B-repeat-containing protein [Paludibacteraceae bacterium]